MNESIGVCRVCFNAVWSDTPYTQDLISGWYYHAECVESEKRKDEDE